MDWWAIGQVLLAVTASFSLLALFSRSFSGVDQYDEHFIPPPPLAPVPRALLRGPDNDDRAPADAETQPAMRNRAGRRAA